LASLALTGSFDFTDGETLDHLVAFQMLGHNSAGGSRCDFRVRDHHATPALDADDWFLEAETHLATDRDFDVVNATPFEFIECGGHNIARAGGNGCGTHIEHNAVLLLRSTQGNMSLCPLSEFLEFLDIHDGPPVP